MDKQFEHYYHQIRSKQKRDALMWSGLLMVLYLTSGYFAEFSLTKVITNAPHFFDYLADTIPVLKWDVLFSGRDANGHAIE
ncbi:MAG: phosphonate ABC transporter, permease protein PhnE, partial [Vibrio casei]